MNMEPESSSIQKAIPHGHVTMWYGKAYHMAHTKCYSIWYGINHGIIGQTMRMQQAPTSVKENLLYVRMQTSKNIVWPSI